MPISSSSTLNAMPYKSPGNLSTSSKPTPGRPETFAMPVAMLVIVPTSRGLSCGVNASRTWLIPANALSNTFWRLSGSMFMVLCFGLRFFRFRLGFGLRFSLGFVLLFQEFIDAFFQRHQIIGDAPRHLLSIRGEFNAADQIWRGLEPDVDFGREGFVERILYRRALFRRQVKRAAHERGGRRCLQGLGEACFRLAVDLSQAASEHLAQALFQ